MTARELIQDAIDCLEDRKLEELLAEMRQLRKSQGEPPEVMLRLRQIKLQGPPDLTPDSEQCASDPVE